MMSKFGYTVCSILMGGI